MYLLLKALTVVIDLRANRDYATVIMSTLLRITGTLYNYRGGLPPEAKPNEMFGGSKVHFCHGSHTVIPIFTLAMECFPDLVAIWLEAAGISGELLWARCLHLSCSGGIAGAGYLMHSLHRMFYYAQQSFTDEKHKEVL